MTFMKNINLNYFNWGLDLDVSHSDVKLYFTSAQGRCGNQLAIIVRQETTEAKKEGEAAPKKKKKEKKPEKVRP